jgi:hypothetical protein
MTEYGPAAMFFLMICGHAVCDFALQNEWIATNKNRHFRLKLSPEQQKQTQIIWPYLLTAHALHHGLAVFLITQKLSLGIAETALHWLTDFGKCEKWFGFHTDQAIHVLSKFLWIYLLMNGWVSF